MLTPVLAPEPVLEPPSPSQPHSGPAPHRRGLSLRPSDAVDPYEAGRFAPELTGPDAFSMWCPHCHSSMQIVAERIVKTPATEYDPIHQRPTLVIKYFKYVETICHTCSNPQGQRPGVYKRWLQPIECGEMPQFDE